MQAEEKKFDLQHAEKEIVLLYSYVKKTLLFAEEITPGFKDYIHPFFEINRAYDHFNRAAAVKHGLVTIEGEDGADRYIYENLKKAKGHLYRAYFDIMDWLSVNLRETIPDIFGPYSAESIQAVVPEYFTDIVPLVNNISEKIADIRNNKDVTNSATWKIIEEYGKLVETLKKLRDDAERKIPGLIEYEKRRSKGADSALFEKILIGLFLTAFGGLIGWLIKVANP